MRHAYSPSFFDLIELIEVRLHDGGGSKSKDQNDPSEEGVHTYPVVGLLEGVCDLDSDDLIKSMILTALPGLHNLNPSCGRRFEQRMGTYMGQGPMGYSMGEK